jgi:hypothetical protein
MRLTGQLLRLEPRNGTFRDRESGQPVPWSHHIAHVLDGVEVTRVKVKDPDFPHFPRDLGKNIDVPVTVEPGSGRSGLYLVITFAPEQGADAKVQPVRAAS